MSEQEFDLYSDLEESHWWYRARRDILSAYVDLIEDKQHKKILEIGCGTGGNLRFLFEEFGELTGIDSNQFAVAHAARKLNGRATILQGDANDLSIPPESMDCVALLDVLYHENIKSVDEVLVAAYKILKKGGYILISDGAFNFLQGTHSATVGSARRFTRKELTDALERLNFRVIRRSYWGWVVFLLLFMKRAVIEKLYRKKAGDGQFDFVRIPVVDELLYYFVSAEKHILRRFSLPFGASVAVLAQK